MIKDPFILLDAIYTAYNLAGLEPENGVTHCNAFVNAVCKNFGYVGFDGLLANEIIAKIAATDSSWKEIPISLCQEFANRGALIIVGMAEEPHGHVNIIVPGKEKNSPRLGAVPVCANIGQNVFFGKGINWAFQSLPKAWAWRQSL